jgi:hypothetical protein
MSVEIKGTNLTATLTGYAYETIPNKPIIAGKIEGPDEITVEPATLGHLAAGTRVAQSGVVSECRGLRRLWACRWRAGYWRS